MTSSLAKAAPAWTRTVAGTYLIVMASLAIISWLDLVTGPELAFFVFYFIPIAVAGWNRGRLEGILVAVASTAIWHFTYISSGGTFSSNFVMLWNTAVRLAIFLIIALTMARIGNEIQRLRGLLPICGCCKKVRSDSGYWEKVEDYFRKRDRTEFTHSICPECAEHLRHPVTLFCAKDPEEVFRLKHTLTKHSLPHIVHHTATSTASIDWLEGKGEFADRQTHPIPDLLVLQSEHPEEECFKLLQWLRQQSQFKDLPALVIGETNATEVVKRAYDLGATAFFPNTTGYEELAEFLRLSKA